MEKEEITRLAYIQQPIRWHNVMICRSDGDQSRLMTASGAVSSSWVKKGEKHVYVADCAIRTPKVPDGVHEA